MTETEPTTKPATKPEAAKPEVNERDIGNGVRLKVESFTEKESKLYGFKFNRVKFITAKDAADHFTRISKGGKSGDEVICAMVNSNLSARMRSQATQIFLSKVKKIKDDDDAKPIDLTDEELDTIRKECNNVLISEEDALEYTPGERDVSAISGLRKQKDDLLKTISKLRDIAISLKNSGNIVEAKKHANMAQEKLSQFYEIDTQLKAAEAKAEAKAEEDVINLLKD